MILLELDGKGEVPERKIFQEILQRHNAVHPVTGGIVNAKAQQLFISIIRNQACAISCPVQLIIVEQHQYAILGFVNICLNSIGAHPQTSVKSAEGIFGEILTCASVCVINKHGNNTVLYIL